MSCFQGRKVVEGAEREARSEEPPFPVVPQTMCEFCYSTHAKERNMHLHIAKTLAVP